MSVADRTNRRRLRPQTLLLFVRGLATIGTIVISFFASSPADTMNKCRDNAGRVTYADQPCEMSGLSRDAAPARPSSAPDKTIVTSPAPSAKVPDYQPPQTVEVPPLPDVDVSGLPKDERGRPIVSQTPGALLVLEKSEPGPVQALARCSSLVTRCVEPGKRDLDTCVMSAPRCTTDKPWQETTPCCPPVCWERYDIERKSGKTPLAAYDRVFFGENTCIPNLRRSGVP
jgi:hypothetical protein